MSDFPNPRASERVQLIRRRERDYILPTPIIDKHGEHKVCADVGGIEKASVVLYVMHPSEDRGAVAFLTPAQAMELAGELARAAHEATL